jgi:hypothetical protein
MSVQPHKYSDGAVVNYPDNQESVVPNIISSYTVDSPKNLPPGISSLADLAAFYPKVVSPGMPGVSPGNISASNSTFADIQNVLGTSPADAKLKITPFYAEKGVVPLNTETTRSAIEGLVLKSEPWNLDIVVGAWGNRVEQENNDFAETEYEPFIYGTTTSLAAIDGLQAGNVTVNYTGTTLANQTPVDMTIDFGNGTWSGSWNNGVDSNVQVSKDSLGVWHATGNMGFKASGTLSGSNLVATTITAGDGTIGANSVVENAVFGNKAQMVGGGYQVTKSTDAYTAATQSDITIAVDKKLVNLPE